MKIAVISTGAVGRTLAGKLEQLGHDVVIGTRNVDQTPARTEPDGSDHPPTPSGSRATDAQETVKGILRELGRPDEAVLDLGGIRAARGAESYS
jgi:Trk K+ transport system NAD-binding subunit